MSDAVEDSGEIARPALALRAEWPALLAMLSVVVIANHYSRLNQHNLVDDAMTSLQYAKQLALGNGLVFNPGERVEGYTNFLWVAFMAPIYLVCRALGADFVFTMIQVNVLFAAGVVGLVYALGARLWGPRHLATFLALGLCVVDNSFTVWAALGLEVEFLAFWMLLALLAQRSTWRFRALLTGLALLCAHLTRPDAGLFCAAVIGNELVEAGLALRTRNRPELKRTLADALLMSAVWLGPYALYFLWRYRYYGALFPNTYYLKLDGEIDAWARGVAYLTSFLRVRGWLPILSLGALFSLRDRTVRTLFSYLVAHTLYVTYVGGDFFPGHRFFVPEIPELALLVGASVASLWRLLSRGRPRAALARHGITPETIIGFGFSSLVWVLAVLWVRGSELGPVNGAILEWRDILSKQRRLLPWVREQKSSGATFATCLIGHTGYYADVRVLDACGVIDPVIARRHVKNFGHGIAGHEKIAPLSYILAQRPTYIGVRVFPDDLWAHGYYLDADVPQDTVEGIWVRDSLLEQGELIESTRVSFDAGRPAGWLASGSAFEDWPSSGHRSGQGEIVGAQGAFVNSYQPGLGTRAVGTLRSPAFDLLGDELLLRMSGGNEPELLHVDLWIDGSRVFTSTGRSGDSMSRRAWDIRPYRGRKAELQIVDRSVDDWGYIAVDEIVQWRAR